MQLLSISDIFSGNIARAVCWMLVHSLWMGLALTIVTGIIILSTKRKTALLRYNLLSGALLLFTIGMITILMMQVTTSSTHLNQQVASSTATAIINTNNDIQAFSITQDRAGFTSSIINFFNNHANSIVMIWFIIIAFRCVRLIGGLQKIKQIRTTQLLPVGEYWSERLLALSVALQIKTPVQFFQSGLAKIPMVIGHFKPVILFPVGLITSLPAQEVEAVLLHELAHIRRKDYLVNMLQHFVEILFFFNPAILWVSALIKMERENCCDDIAVVQSSSKRNYINALVSFQEYHLNMPRYATAIADNKKHLLQRVKRMLYNNNKTLNAMEKTFLTLCFIVTISLTVFFTQAQTNNVNNTTAKIAANDTTLADRHYNPADYPEGSSTSYSETINGVIHTLCIFKREGKLYEIYGDITSFKIDGKAIPQSQWGKYKTLISQLRTDYQTSHVAMAEQIGKPSDIQRLEEKKLAEQLQLLANKSKLDQMQLEALSKQDKLTAEQKQLMADNNKITAEQKELLMQLDKLKAEQDSKNVLQKKQMTEAETKALLQKLEEEQKKMSKDQKTLLEQKLKAERDAQQLLEQKRKMEKDNKATDADSKTSAADSRAAAADSKEPGVKSSTGSKREIERSVDDGSKVIKSKLSYTENATAYNATKPAYKEYETPYKKGTHIVSGIQTSDFSNSAKDVDIAVLTNNIIADLKKEKVITNEANLSYKMNNDVLIVNGQTQPEALHQALKAKYVKSPDWNLLYNWTITSK